MEDTQQYRLRKKIVWFAIIGLITCISSVALTEVVSHWARIGEVLGACFLLYVIWLQYRISKLEREEK